MENDKYCGDCCWFYAEDTYGFGACPFQFGECVNCGFMCTAPDKFASKEEMRHYMAVLLQANRWRRDDNVPAIYKMPDATDFGKAIDFSYGYMKVFSNL